MFYMVLWMFLLQKNAAIDSHIRTSLRWNDMACCSLPTLRRHRQQCLEMTRLPTAKKRPRYGR